MSKYPADQPFSHPDTHESHETPSSSEAGQPSWTNLFQEPVTPQQASSEH
ncbi:hypothetical protein LFM09_07310 [Lentzea alba]